MAANAYECILERRSIREFTGEPVTSADVDRLLRAAVAAPSAGNGQPWAFVVIRKEETLAAIMAAHPYAQMLRKAGAAIVVCGELARQKYEGYWVQDCSAAAQNTLLAAHAIGLGAVWLGVHPRPDRVAAIGTIVGLPEGVVPLCVIAIGHPAEEKPPSDRFEASRVHDEVW